MRAILAGGGTGGHVIPALAIAQQLQKQYNAEILFIGTARGIENRLVPAAGFPLRLVQVGALKNVSLATRLRTFSDLPRSVWESRRIFREFRPDVVIGVGGYASGPGMLAAVLMRIPTLVFEPNFVPGFANRVVARFVSAAAVHFEETGRYFRRCEVTGVPVREAFFQISGDPATPTVLVFGGSQGAHAINQVVMESAGEMLARTPGLRIIHQTGERDFSDAQAAYAKLGGAVEAHRFIDDMPAAFARASLLICRSGASTVAEVTAAGKPAIFVPFPRAADDHQKSNAEALVKAEAAIMLEETQLTRETLAASATSLLADGSRLRKMGEAARKLSHPNAARDIAAMAAKLAGAAR
ncbi:UDP-N-acetylglucosamine--N-acetylmuramyl-(pentapeptide) pyrophosphoryl-undecaprenol N-acetylglucosamine transferase [Candidatus Sulfotelmatobacter sp. SbA7]|nr:UDP-N-acetylglucosamine--N-acetylmuramyl-(pentapeptide) pyrophosphoryl-undecaprenol N-acetylglucosamine transferase [Candidatus Sulfotelmatobacter sp. SbA7]